MVFCMKFILWEKVMDNVCLCERHRQKFNGKLPINLAEFSNVTVFGLANPKTSLNRNFFRELKCLFYCTGILLIFQNGQHTGKPLSSA